MVLTRPHVPDALQFPARTLSLQKAIEQLRAEIDRRPPGDRECLNAIIRLFAERVDGWGAFVLRLSHLGEALGVLGWVVAWPEKFDASRAGAQPIVGLLDEVFTSFCALEPHKPFHLEKTMLEKCVGWNFLYRHLGVDCALGVTLRETSADRLVLFVVRKVKNDTPPFRPKEDELFTKPLDPKSVVTDFGTSAITTFATLAKEFSSELDVADPKPFEFLVKKPAREPEAESYPKPLLSLDSSLVATSISPEIDALITCAFGPVSRLAGGLFGLPPALHNKIREKRDAYFSEHCAAARSNIHKDFRGRVLIVEPKIFKDGTLTLGFIDDTNTEELERYVREVRKLPGADFRMNVMKAVLFMAENVRGREDEKKMNALAAFMKTNPEYQDFRDYYVEAFRIVRGEIPRVTSLSRLKHKKLQEEAVQAVAF